MDKTAEKSRELQVITPAELLEHWQGHRNLTRNVVETSLKAIGFIGMGREVETGINPVSPFPNCCYDLPEI